MCDIGRPALLMAAGQQIDVINTTNMENNEIKIKNLINIGVSPYKGSYPENPFLLLCENLNNQRVIQAIRTIDDVDPIKTNCFGEIS
jgi:hypothetical protein